MSAPLYQQMADQAPGGNQPGSLKWNAQIVAKAYAAAKKDLQKIGFDPANPNNGPGLVTVMAHFHLALESAVSANKHLTDYIQSACGLSVNDLTPSSQPSSP